ncbi:MAG TPA: hypothetical protein VND63_02495 [Rhodanobacteraceae bacterium]|nr:hypothetical protein [Rhodanobacteraceae bacterium]
MPGIPVLMPWDIPRTAQVTLMDTQSAGSSPGTSRAALLDALRYWEPRRIGYNLVLAAVLFIWLVLTWPHFRTALTERSLLELLALAAIANAGYCAAYFAEIALRHSPFRGTWKSRRWALWLAGTLFAVVLECYWIADEIYPYVR